MLVLSPRCSEARTSTGPVFIKPADGRKGFEGAVYTNGTGLPTADAQPDDTAVLVADPVAWEVEFRCFVLEGQVVTLFPYLRDGELAQDEDGHWHSSPDELAQAPDYAAQVLAEIDVPAGIVIDVGRMAGHGWAVVEANSAWGAGVYGCDPRRVLDVLTRACVPRDRLTDGDAPWAVEALELDA